MKLDRKLRRTFCLAFLALFPASGVQAAGQRAAALSAPIPAAVPTSQWLGLSLVQLVGELGPPEGIFYIHKGRTGDGLMILYVSPSRLFETDGRGIVDRVYEPPESVAPQFTAKAPSRD